MHNHPGQEQTIFEAFPIAYSSIDTDLNALYQLRQEQLIAAVSDPEQSFAAAAYKHLKYLHIYSKTPEGIGRMGNVAKNPVSQLVVMTDKLAPLMTTDEAGNPTFDFSNASNFADSLRKTYYDNETDAAGKADALYRLSFIAALLQPEHVTEADFKRRPRETPEQKGYRVAAGTLRAIAVNEKRFVSKYGAMAERFFGAYVRNETDRLFTGASLDQDIELYNNFILQTKIASGLLDLVQTSTLHSDRLREHVLFAKYAETHIDAAASVEEPTLEHPPTPTEETGWDVLPGLPRNVARQILREAGIAPPDEDNPHEPAVLSKRDQRLLKLGRLAFQWYGNIEDIRIAVRRLGDTKDDEFQIAILTEQHPDGRFLEHAVAEAGDMATRVLRADKGWEPGAPRPWLTWRDVFATTKKDAELLGADKIIHNENYDHYIAKALYRSEAELDEPIYSRRRAAARPK